jgi:hypothetical protein
MKFALCCVRHCSPAECGNVRDYFPISALVCSAPRLKRVYNAGIMKQEVHIASPCSADWDRMVGNERIRHCPQCKLDVYNFSALTRAEVEGIVLQHEGRLCARYYQRSDGTMMTRNCPERFRVVMQRVFRFASAALAAVMSTGPVMATSTFTKHDPTLLQIQPAQTVLALQVVDVMGAVVSNAAVAIVNEKTGTRIDAKTDDSGQLRLADLPLGTYEITVIVPGFKTLKLNHIAVPARDPLKLQLELAVLMGEVVIVYQGETESSPVSELLSEPSLSQSSVATTSPHNPNAFRRFFSALRRRF